VYVADAYNHRIQKFATPEHFIRGDVDGNDEINVSDVGGILSYLSGLVPVCRELDRLDVNDDGQIDVSDPPYLMRFLFGGGSPPPAPYPLPGADTTEDALDCPQGTTVPFSMPSRTAVFER
jgi:hypothetical protein